MELHVEHLCKAFHGVPVLRDVSFTAREGITCVMAPSGSGKTTLLRILLGLEKADSGTVRGLEGVRVSAVFQEDRLLGHLNALENLRFALGETYDGETARNLLRQLGLAPGDEKAVREYSGGMRRRLALARALLRPSAFLTLDEPFAGLDAENRARAVSAVRACGEGRVVLLVSHNPADAEELDASVIHL